MISKKQLPIPPEGVIVEFYINTPFMVALLQFLGDHREHCKQEAMDYLIAVFELTDEYIEARTPSGKSREFDNTVNKAREELKNLRLIEPTQRSHFRISPYGLEILQQKTTRNSGPMIRKLIHYLRAFEVSGPNIYIDGIQIRESITKSSTGNST